MSPLEKALLTLNEMARPSTASTIDPRIRLAVTLVYIGVVLSVPVADPGMLIWMFVFPILTAETSGIGYGRVLLRSLWILPLIGLIAIFNPIIDRETMWVIGGVSISRGWVMFFSVVIRGLLSFQALLVLTMTMGFYEICNAFRGLGCPGVLTTQLMMVYRYLGVLMDEALTMHRARLSRGFGRRSYPLKMWGPFIGQLLLRSLHRSRRIDAAMESRGFTGSFRVGRRLGRPSARSWVWMACWLAVIFVFRFIDLTTLLNDFIVSHYGG